MYKEMKGNEDGLVGYWPWKKENWEKDLTGNGNDLVEVNGRLTFTVPLVPTPEELEDIDFEREVASFSGELVLSKQDTV